MHISQDGPALSRSSYYASLSTLKSKHLVNDSSIQFNNCRNQFNQTKRQCENAKSVLVPHFSSTPLSLYSNQKKICKPNIATKSTYCNRENVIHGYKRPCINNIGCYKCQSKKCMYIKDVQLYYVFDKSFHRQKEPQIAQKSVNKCTALCQVDPLKGLKDDNKALKQLVNAFTESVECKCIANKLKQLIPHSNERTPQCACAEAETRAVQCKCKCIANKLKRFIPHSNELNPQCACAEAETQVTECKCNCVANKLKQFIPRSNEFKPHYALAEAETQAAECQCKCVANKLKQFIPRSNELKPQYTLAEAETQAAECKCKCVANKLKQFIPRSNELKPQYTLAEAETQAAECKCKCVGNKLKQFIPHSNELKPQYTFAEAETQAAECKCKCVVNKLKQFIPRSNELKPQYALAEAETRVAECKCKCVGNKLKQFIPHSNELKPQYTLAEAATQAVGCKCVAKKLKLVPHMNEHKTGPTHVEAATQGHNKYGGRVQRARGISTVCKCPRRESTEREFFTTIISGFNEPQENIAQTAQKCVTSSTRCQADCIKNEQESFKRLFRRLIKAPTNSGTCVEAKTQSPCYEGSYQRAGRESFCREIGTSGTPNQKQNSELQENPREEVNYEPTEDAFFDSYTPVTVDRRIGCNGRYIMKCSNDVPQCTRKLAQTSTNCHLDDINKKKGVFTVFCNMMLQPTNLFTVSKKCCKNRGTICQVDENEGGVLKKFCELLIEPKNMTHTASPCRKSRSALCNVDGDRDEDSAIKKLCQVLLDPKGYKNKVRPRITGAEVMTQSRSYGGRQQRAGREIFYKNRGTSGAPKFRHPNVEKEEYEEVIEELPTCLEIQPDTNKAVGIGTNCKFSLGWYKDRHAYGEPKPQCDFKGAIEHWNEVPLRQSFCREIGTSGTPNQKKNSELPREVNYYDHSEDAYYDSYKPVTVDRRIGCNGRNITKCSKDVAQCTRKLAQTSTNCHLDDINKEKGVFTVFCNMMLQPTNLFPVSKKCCKNRGTICQIDDNEGGVLKKFCELLIEPKNMTHTASPCRKSRGALCNVDGDRDEDSAIKKLCQVLLDPKGYKNTVRPRITGAEVMTQSRSYGGRQQRAGREIFCKNRGTSGAPKFRHPNVEKEEYEEVIEEIPTCLEIQPDTNKAVGIGTNCKFSLGWYKDRHAYGEPKPQCDLKGAIEQWNEVPLRQTGTKIGASLKADSRINFYNTNAATQSRKCRSRHLRAGRETFYKDAQTSCVSKNNKHKVEGNYNVFNPPMECPAPDRKAIRFGSDCSFSFEISKDRNTESPDKSKPCDDKIDGNQTKNPFYSKFIGQWRSSQGNEQKAGEPGKSDACTCTHVCDDECQSQNRSKACERRPLHIGSKVSYDFNFSKSISPPKPTSLVAQEPCIKSVCSKQEGTTKCDATISAECVPDSNNYDSLNTSSRVTKRVDFPDPIHIKLDNNKTAKECFLELVSKKNFLRLIKGDQNPEKEKVKEKVELGSHKIPKIEIPQIVCPATCNRKCEPAEKPDQPFRVESSFNFDYNMRNVKPKHEKVTYEENFPRIEDFSGSATKLNLFRLIIGKVRKRIKPLVSPACDPVECRLRKQRHSSWFTYILDNIKQARQVNQIKKEDEEAKNFFSDLLLKPSSCLSQFDNNMRKLRRDRRYLYLMSNLREQLKKTVIPPPDKKSTNSFISQMLARSRDHSRRRRRRRRHGRGKIIPKWYEEDIDTLSSSILPSSRKSRTSDEDCTPCQIASDCCFKCDYKKLNNSDNETQSSKSTVSSMKYATT